MKTRFPQNLAATEQDPVEVGEQIERQKAAASKDLA